jgi:type II secretory pathway predicted ATPase ExeA
MFLRYYGLREQPFGVTPDPRFLFETRVYREALASLQYGIQAGRGFIALIAAPGMGKTTLLFQLLEQLRHTTRTAFLFHTQCDSLQMMASLVAELEYESETSDEKKPASTASENPESAAHVDAVAGSAATPSTHHADMLSLQDSLNRLLVRESRAGRTPVVVIDEAQNLQEPVMETVRLLSDFETPSAKLLQIVLAGQTELGERLALPRLAQLQQRISIVSRLSALDAQEVGPYIETRLRVAGLQGAPLFTPQAYRRIAQQSAGIPRNINNLCFHALSLGCAQGLKRIDVNVLDEVAADLNWNSFSSSASSPSRGVIPAPVATASIPARAVASSAHSPRAASAVEVSSGPGARPTVLPPSQPAATKQTLPPESTAKPIHSQAQPKRPLPSAHHYRLPVLVFLTVLIAGLAWMVWEGAGGIFSLISSRASAANVNSQPALASTPATSKENTDKTPSVSPDSEQGNSTEPASPNANERSNRAPKNVSAEPRAFSAAKPVRHLQAAPGWAQANAGHRPALPAAPPLTQGRTENLFAPEILFTPVPASRQ